MNTGRLCQVPAYGWQITLKLGVVRVTKLSYGVVCMILCLVVLIQYRHVTDGRTHDDSIYHASIALRGKNVWRLLYGWNLACHYVLYFVAQGLHWEALCQHQAGEPKVPNTCPRMQWSAASPVGTIWSVFVLCVNFCNEIYNAMISGYFVYVLMSVSYIHCVSKKVPTLNSP